MNKELIDRAWACLPKEFKEEVKEIYSIAIIYHPCGYNHKTDLLKYLFGRHNLTSDAEGEELLTCEKYKVGEALNYCDELDSISGSHNMRNWGEQMIAYLFGSKCLLDELNEDNFAKSEPKPAETKNEGTRQKQCVPKNAESGTHSFNYTLKDSFHDHNRLHIAAQIVASMIGGDEWTPWRGSSNKEIWHNMAKSSLEIADALIAECEKGGIK